jgi:hypothetical protein
MNYLLSSAIKAAEQDAKKESPKPTENRQEAKSATKQLGGKEAAKGAEQAAANGKPEADELGASVEKDRNQPSEENNKPSKNAAEIRYFLSCKQCAFSAGATDLRGLGSQLNTHGSGCGRDPVLVLEGEQDQADSAIKVSGETQTSPDPEVLQVPLCA